MISIRRMDRKEINRLTELDRRERVTEFYSLEDGELKCHEVDWNVPQWNFTEKFKEWELLTESYNNIWGAFHKGTLIGFSVYRKNLTADMAQLALLHVSNGYRGKGLGKSLMAMVMQQAMDDSKTWLYVSSAPSKNTVDFYRSQGFEVTKEPDRELFELEPDDIHMIMRIIPE